MIMIYINISLLNLMETYINLKDKLRVAFSKFEYERTYDQVN